MSAFDAGGLLEILGRASLQGALFIAAVWIVCRLFPRLPAAVRCGLWWAACLKLLVGLVWVTPVELPVLPAAVEEETAVAIRRGGSGRWEGARPALLGTAPASEGGSSPRPPVQTRPSEKTWRELLPISLLAGWGAGLLIHFGLLVREVRRTRRIVRRSEPVRTDWIAAVFAELRERLGLSRSPGLRGSADVDTPQAVGLVYPLVLLPSPGLDGLSPSELSMTLCHELAHVRRKDLWLGWVPALAQRIFFFHPLAALAAREYALAREAACDAEVLRVLGTAPRDYGRLLLRWGVAPRETGLAAAGASPSLRNLKRRLQMLQHSSNGARRPSAWWWLAGAAALAALIPFQMVAQEEAPAAPEAAEVHPAPPDAPAPPELPPPPPAKLGEIPPPPPAEAPPPPPAPAPVTPPAPPAAVAGVTPEAMAESVRGGIAGGVAGGVRGGVEGGVAGGIAEGVRGGVVGGVPGVAAVPPVPTVAPVPGVAPVPRVKSVGALAPVPGVAPTPRPTPTPRTPGAHGKLQAPPPPPPAPPAPPKPPKPPKPAPKESSFHWSMDDDGNSWILFSGKDNVTMSGSSDDLKRVKRLYRESDGEMLWFRRDGKEYVVRDAATLKAVKDLWKPVTELGKQQAKLGAEQARLGSQQAELGGQQAALGAKQAALGAQMAALSAEQARKGSEAEDAEYERRAREIGRQMEELGRQQEELGRQQEKYGAPQEELGRQQEELGRKQEAASKKAENETRALLDRAIANGVAQPVG
jgi:beta-lactamase regulating signal transducer with metallopeptidase domain